MTLSVRQKKVIEALFTGLSEQDLFEKYTLSRSMFLSWLRQKDFTDSLAARVAGGAVRAEMMISAYSPIAVARLVGLTENENPETARKACLDVLGLLRNSDGALRTALDGGQSRPDGDPLTPGQASQLLAALAEAGPEPCEAQ